MHTSYLTLAASALLVAAPFAAQAVTADVDTDGNGTFSFVELQVAYPDLTEETFAAIDTNADGEADMDEVTAAEEAGLLPAT